MMTLLLMTEKKLLTLLPIKYQPAQGTRWRLVLTRRKNITINSNGLNETKIIKRARTGKEIQISVTSKEGYKEVRTGLPRQQPLFLY